MSNVVDFMSQPSTHFEPTDPTPLRSRVVSNEEFNYLVVHYGTTWEPRGDTAISVISGVLYITKLEEVAC